MLILNNLKEQIIELINNSKLPVDAIYLILKDLFTDINVLYQQEITKEKQQQKNNEIKNNKEEPKE